MSRQSTVVEQKQHFLQLRKQYLSRGIVPSEKLKRIAQEGGVELSVLKGALDKVNRELKQHSRKVYSRQMTQHIIEQIDKYYWATGARDAHPDHNDDNDDDEEDAASTSSSLTSSAPANRVYQSDDLTQDDAISKLPTRWDISADSHPTPSTARPDQDREEEEEEEEEGGEFDQDSYQSLLIHLQTLSARRLTLQQKLNRYHTLLALLKPYRDPMHSIQPNLVGKDAPLALELAKTRTLAIRVAGRVGERFRNGQVRGANEDEDGDLVMGVAGHAAVDAEKVNRVLDAW